MAASRQSMKVRENKEGAILYSMSQNKFEAFAKEAGATYKVGGIVLVNTEIIDKYIELFREL